MESFTFQDRESYTQKGALEEPVTGFISKDVGI